MSLVCLGHNHAAEVDQALVREVKTTLRKRSKTETTTLPKIYKEASATLAGRPAAAAMMPTYGSVSSTMHRCRREDQPAIPRTRDALVLPQKYQQTTTGHRFFLAAGHRNKYIIWSTDDDLRELCNTQHVAMDGTFSTCPALFKQVGLYILS
jgi:hypothetical protein